MSCHSTRCARGYRRPAFTIIETLGWMSLLGIFALMSSQAFIQTKNLMAHTHHNARHIARMDGMVRLLRRDVWPCQSISMIEELEHDEADDPQHASEATGPRIVLNMDEAGERQVIWIWGRTSPLVRRVETNAGQVTSDLQWKNAGDHWLTTRASGVTLHMQPAANTKQPQRMEIVSQMLLYREMNW